MYRFVVFCCLSLIPLAYSQAAGYQAEGNAVRDHARAAMQAQQAGDCSSAISEYQAALADTANQPELWTNLGVCFAQQGDFSRAIASYEKALQLRPEFDSARLDLALAYYKDERWDDSIRTLKQYRARHPQDLRSGLLLADCYFREGSYKDVIRVLAPLDRQQPGNLAVAYLLGTSYIRSGDRSHGESYVNRIMSQGDTPQVHMMLGDAYYQGHEYPHAKEEFKRAIALDPKLPSAHLRLAQTQLLSGENDAVIPELLQEYALNPNDFETNFYLGIAYKRVDDNANAQRFFRRAETIRPDAYEPNLQLALIDYEQNHLAEARQRLERAVKQDPDQTEAHVVLGRIYFRLKMRAEGEREQAIIRRLNAEHQAASIRERERQSTRLQPGPTVNQ